MKRNECVKLIAVIIERQSELEVILIKGIDTSYRYKILMKQYSPYSIITTHNNVYSNIEVSPSKLLGFSIYCKLKEKERAFQK